MSIRILQVLDKISIDSGVSVVVMNFYRHLDHKKVIFDFMVNEDVDLATRLYIEERGSRIFVMPELKLKNLFKYIRSLTSFFKNSNYLIIHGHVSNSALFYLGLAKRVPIRIIHSHSSKLSDVLWKRSRNWILTRFIKCVANEFVACSEEAGQALFGKKKDFLIIDNAIDVVKFLFHAEKRQSVRSELGFSNEYLIGHVGRFVTVKNHFFILDVFSELYKLNSNARLLLIGDGELKDKIIKQIKVLEISEFVSVLSPSEEIEKYLCAIDVLILPSQFEGLGLIAVEAQAAGLPVLVSEYVPVKVNVTDGVERLKLDKWIWVESLNMATNNFDRVNRGKKVQGSVFDISVQSQKLLDYYMKLIGSRAE